MILVTGAYGSVGQALIAALEELGHEVIATDIETMDVTNEQQVRLILGRKQPDVIFHLAGAKHAPDGELDPWHVAEVNVIGTRNIIKHRGDAKVILASTCKACDPETAYGASKLIAERMVLNAGGVVVRYFNIREASGNVFRLWESLDDEEPIPYTECSRYFISMDEAVALTVEALELPSGRYAPEPGELREMRHEAISRYPERLLQAVPRRRGDRHMEPLLAGCESFEQFDGYFKVVSPHDPVPAMSVR